MTCAEFQILDYGIPATREHSAAEGEEVLKGLKSVYAQFVLELCILKYFIVSSKFAILALLLVSVAGQTISPPRRVLCASNRLAVLPEGIVVEPSRR